ncbi:hypothetical protein RHSIM_Rhsim07G0144600 [Rhododendron simsii]|uniref:Uncharacterized protein n=1 Tax=Rhododendron simsii TaxID=118357 RepID=A0A834LF81_RHOSS|nr:hypothetical protein RHSIM_Rhsim07G0144600 [Rhododendron simsii]
MTTHRLISSSRLAYLEFACSAKLNVLIRGCGPFVCLSGTDRSFVVGESIVGGYELFRYYAQTLEMLEKKEKVLLRKAAAEIERAKEFTRAKNKRAAIQCLKRKRLYEQQVEQLGNFQLRIHDQMIMLEGSKATTETVAALRTGAAAMKAMQKATYFPIVQLPGGELHLCISALRQQGAFVNIDDVDKTMDEINEQTENMKQIQEALSAPIGSAADFDEDELEAELEELEGSELEEQLLQPATTVLSPPLSAPEGKIRPPVRPAPRKNTAEEDELAALQAEMAL